MKSLIAILLLCSLSAQAEIQKVFETKSGSFIPYETFLSRISANSIIVLGEFHNNVPIQQAEAQIVHDTVKFTRSENHFQLMWEFLNFTEQKAIEGEFKKFAEGLISVQDFIARTAGEQNSTYAPMIEVTANLQGTLFGLNLPRALKQKVIKEGIQSIDPDLVPAGHYVGGDHYLERFIEVSGDHMPAEKIPAYFLAQCLTDSVMAFHTLKNHHKLSFVVAGSFHTDFYDGTVARLAKWSDEKVGTLKIVDEAALTEEDVTELMNGHAKFGHVADYIVFTKN